LLILQGAVTIPSDFIQKLDHPMESRTYVGKGNKTRRKSVTVIETTNKIQIAIFDDELSRVGKSGILSKHRHAGLLDRTHLILDIFANARAHCTSSHAGVEPGTISKPLLPTTHSKSGPHLEKQRGGIGLRGPGETEHLKLDRRVIRDKYYPRHKREAPKKLINAKI
jgi:GTP-binding protein HflX